MAVPRVDWVCPSCGRRYAVRADVPTPALCPACQSAATAANSENAEFSFAEAPPPDGGRPKTGPPAQAPAASRSFQPGLPALPEPSLPPAAERLRRVSKRYPVLRVLSILFRVAGLALLALGLILMARGTFTEGLEAKGAAPLIQLGVFAAFGLNAMYLYAAGEVIDVFVAVEENTRRTAELLAAMDADSPRK